MIESWSGSVAYTQAVYSVTAGMHHFKWEYAKDKSTSAGQDTAWVDDIIFPGFVDSDLDGMPDGWELHYALDPLTVDDQEDADGDLFTNGMECLMGTDPQDQTDYPAVTKGFDADMDVDGKDIRKFLEGLSTGILTTTDLLEFSQQFGN